MIGFTFFFFFFWWCGFSFVKRKVDCFFLYEKKPQSTSQIMRELHWFLGRIESGEWGIGLKACFLGINNPYLGIHCEGLKSTCDVYFIFLSCAKALFLRGIQTVKKSLVQNTCPLSGRARSRPIQCQTAAVCTQRCRDRVRGNSIT